MREKTTDSLAAAETSDEVERSAELIERLLGDPDLRRRFRTDPAEVLGQHGLCGMATGLGQGRRALLTLELRESRSSLAGAMVAAAAEGVDFAHVAERAAPGLERGAGRALDRLVRGLSHHSSHHAVKPAKPSLSSGAAIPPLAADKSAGGHGSAAALPAATGAAGAGAIPATPAAAAGVALPQTGAAAGPGAAGPAAAGGALRHPGTPGDIPSGGAEHRHRALGGLPLSETAHQDLLRYPGDQASPRQIAAWMGAHAKQAGLPPELPVMAALTESGLHNLSYGDRDSVGFFQMRVGIWNQGAYAGYPSNPQLQIKWFIDQALAAKAQNPALAQSPTSWGEWAASVEQPAAQYRFRYGLQLSSAQGLLHGVDLGAATLGAAAQTASPGASGGAGQAALQVAMRYLGTPYRWGGASPATGFDCSGLVQYSYAQEGIQLPRVAADQFHTGTPIARNALRPGDAVFFADSSGYVHHMGLYVGNGQFINAPRTGENVKISSLSDPYFASQYAGARRFAGGTLGDPSRYARTLPTVGH